MPTAYLPGDVEYLDGDGGASKGYTEKSSGSMVTHMNSSYDGGAYIWRDGVSWEEWNCSYSFKTTASGCVWKRRKKNGNKKTYKVQKRRQRSLAPTRCIHILWSNHHEPLSSVCSALATSLTWTLRRLPDASLKKISYGKLLLFRYSAPSLMNTENLKLSHSFHHRVLNCEIQEPLRFPSHLIIIRCNFIRPNSSESSNFHMYTQPA